MGLKTRKSKLREMVRRRSGEVRNVPTDFPKGLETQIGRYIAAICIAGGGEVAPISCISAQIWRWNQNFQKCAWKLIGAASPSPAMQMAAIYRPICVLRPFGKSVGTLRTCHDLLLTISRNFDFRVCELIFYDFWVPQPQSRDFPWRDDLTYIFL